MKKRKAKGRRGFSDAKKQALKKRFTLNLSREGSREHAAKKTGICYHTVLSWEGDDPKFLSDNLDAKAKAVGEIEASMYRRAKFSDTLAIFYMKCNKREVYGDRFRHEHEIGAGGLKWLVSKLGELLRALVPRECPHCNTNLDLQPRIAQGLLELSAKIGVNP